MATNAISQTDDVRIKQIRPLIPPALLLEDFPLSGAAADTGAWHVEMGREDAAPSLLTDPLVCAHFASCATIPHALPTDVTANPPPSLPYRIL